LTRRHRQPQHVGPSQLVEGGQFGSFGCPVGVNDGPEGRGLQPSYDVLDALAGAPVAAEKLRLLRQRSADAHAVIPEFERVREASMARIEAENALKRLTNHPHDGGPNLKSDDRRVMEAQRLFDKATANFRRLQELQTVRTAAWQSASGALANAETWLKNGRPAGTALEDFDGPKPTLIKNETVVDAVERLRRRVRELRADLHSIESAPYPSKYVKARMRAAVEALSQQGPHVSMMVEHDGGLIWPMTHLRSEVLGAEHPALAFTEVPDAVALMAWLHKDALIKRLDAEIDTESDDPASLSHADREARTAETQADLLDVERTEAAFVFQAQAQGLPCEHRGDISPVALLALRLVTVPREAPPPTSPEHGYNIIGGGRR
jgi:hypothetical protein